MHGRGNRFVPTDEGITFSCRVGRDGNCRAVVLRNGCDFAAACRIKGYRVLIYLPLRRDGHVFSRHSRRNCFVPTHKGITFSCRVGGGGNLHAVILRNGCDGTATCGVKGYRVLIDLPLCRDSHILGRHRRGNCFIPADKGISFSCRVGRCGDCRAIVLRNRGNGTAACGVEGNCILIDFPLCGDSHIFGRHGRRNCLVPTHKGITFSCRVGGGGNIRSVVLCDGGDGTTAVGIKGDGVRINLPLRFDRHVLRGHGRGNRFVPADEGITFSCRVGRSDNRRAIVLRNGCDGTATCGIKGDGVRINLPLRFDRHVLRGHGRGNCLIPAEEGIAIPCRVGRCGNIRTVVLRNRGNFAAACGVEGDRIARVLPQRLYCDVSSDGHGGVHRILRTVYLPCLELLSFGRNKLALRQIIRAAVQYLLGGHCGGDLLGQILRLGAAVRVKRDGMLVALFKCCGNGNVFLRLSEGIGILPNRNGGRRAVDGQSA